MAERARNDGWAQLERALYEAGADEREFIEEAVMLLRGGIRRLQPADPGSMFTPAEADVLRKGGFTLEPRREGEPDVAARTAARAAVMLVEAKSAVDVAKILDVSATRVRQRAMDRTLYAVRSGETWRFPNWQFDPKTGRELRGLAAVLPAFSPTLHPVAVYRFLTEPCVDLEIDDEPVSPFWWLTSGGDPEPVAAIAATL